MQNLGNNIYLLQSSLVPFFLYGGVPDALSLLPLMSKSWSIGTKVPGSLHDVLWNVWIDVSEKHIIMIILTTIQQKTH